MSRADGSRLAVAWPFYPFCNFNTQMSRRLLAIVATIPTLAPYLPAGLSGGPAAALALGTDPGPLLGPLVANLGLTLGLVVLSWLAFRRQEL